MADVLKVENISKKYKNGNGVIEALKQVSFELERGEILAIMGSSGSGKSTLLHILGALDKPDDGKIYLNHVHEKIIAMNLMRQIFEVNILVLYFSNLTF